MSDCDVEAVDEVVGTLIKTVVVNNFRIDTITVISTQSEFKCSNVQVLCLSSDTLTTNVHLVAAI